MSFISPYVSHTSLLFIADILLWESKDIKVSRLKLEYICLSFEMMLPWQWHKSKNWHVEQKPYYIVSHTDKYLEEKLWDKLTRFAFVTRALKGGLFVNTP